MALSIKNPEVEQLARELAAKTNESITDAVLIALRERLAREENDRDREVRVRRLIALSEAGRALPRRDGRTPEEIIGYDEHGLPS